MYILENYSFEHIELRHPKNSMSVKFTTCIVIGNVLYQYSFLIKIIVILITLLWD